MSKLEIKPEFRTTGANQKFVDYMTSRPSDEDMLKEQEQTWNSDVKDELTPIAA